LVADRVLDVAVGEPGADDAERGCDDGGAEQEADLGDPEPAVLGD
jgi:hypothetical protein